MKFDYTIGGMIAIPAILIATVAAVAFWILERGDDEE